MCQDYFRNYKGLFGGLVAAGFLLGLVWLGVDVKNKIGEIPEVKNTITISASGEVFAKPDLAITNFSVVTEAKTVGQALAENTQKMNAVISSIKNEGALDKDLKTTSFNIFPRYEFQKAEPELYPYPPGKRVLVGYEVSQSLQVKIRDLTKVGRVIEKAAAAGANQVGDLQFTIDKEDDFKSQARKQAIDKAKVKAKELTDSLGVRLGRVTSFSEGFSGPIFFGLKEMMAAPTPAPGVPQIETGENKIEVQVTINYEIK